MNSHSHCTMEDEAQLLADGLVAKWRAEWAIADFCVQLVDAHDDTFIRILAKHMRMTHRSIFDWALTARTFPPFQRHLDKSFRWHVTQAKKGAKDGAQTS